MYFYINLYLLFSIIGYFFEEILMFIIGKTYNSSVLYGPWTSVYGFAVYIMLIVYYMINRLNYSKKKEKIIYYFSISIVLSLLEGLTGLIIEKTKNVIYWNYDNYHFNIGHYMSVEVAFVWGILSVISVYYVIPKIVKFIKKIPKSLTFLLTVIYVVDVLISLFK